MDSIDTTMEDIKILLVNAGVHISEIGVVETETSKLFEARFYCTIDRKTDTDSLVMNLMKILGVKSIHLE